MASLASWDVIVSRRRTKVMCYNNEITYFHLDTDAEILIAWICV